MIFVFHIQSTPISPHHARWNDPKLDLWGHNGLDHARVDVVNIHEVFTLLIGWFSGHDLAHSYISLVTLRNKNMAQFAACNSYPHLLGLPRHFINFTVNRHCIWFTPLHNDMGYGQILSSAFMISVFLAWGWLHFCCSVRRVKLNARSWMAWATVKYYRRHSRFRKIFHFIAHARIFGR